MAAIPLPSASVSGAELLERSPDGMHIRRIIDRTKSAEILARSPEVLINSGWYAFSPSVRAHIPSRAPLSNEAHIWPALLAALPSVGCYVGREPWFDTGTKERLEQVASFLMNHEYAPYPPSVCCR